MDFSGLIFDDDGILSGQQENLNREIYEYEAQACFPDGVNKLIKLANNKVHTLTIQKLEGGTGSTILLDGEKIGQKVCFDTRDSRETILKVDNEDT